MGFSNIDKAGTTNAAVFPEPVGAVASTSRPFSRIGMTCICTGVGSFHFEFSMLFNITLLIILEMGISSKVTQRLGISVPLILILSCFLNRLNLSKSKNKWEIYEVNGTECCNVVITNHHLLVNLLYQALILNFLRNLGKCVYKNINR